VTKLCAVSVDLDEIHHYCAIHGLGSRGLNTHAVYDIAVQRLCDWAAEHAIALTLFTVGIDVMRPESAAALARAVALGHEIGNHSLNHHYALTRLNAVQMTTEVAGGADLIADKVGVRPVGFRAPGYTTSDALYRVLCESGVCYSSSVFPCPTYYGLKVAAIWGKRLLGRKSASVIDSPMVLTAPAGPYRIGEPYWKQGEGLTELPIQTTPGLRVPYIGTFLTWWGPRFASWATRRVSTLPFVNLELHGIDVLDRNDGLEALAPYQFDVRIPVAQKLATLSGVVNQLKAAGYSFCRLDEAALRVLPQRI
jgi:peptidoglycan-N-acetylglucosamine deacetylase